MQRIELLNHFQNPNLRLERAVQGVTAESVKLSHQHSNPLFRAAIKRTGKFTWRSNLQLRGYPTKLGHPEAAHPTVKDADGLQLLLSYVVLILTNILIRILIIIIVTILLLLCSLISVKNQDRH